MYDGQKRPDLYLGEGFLLRLPGGRLLERLAVFHKTRGDGPEAAPWLNGPPAEEDATFVLGNASYDEARVLIMNRPAGIADVAGNEIARRNAQLDTRDTLITEVHCESVRIRMAAGVVELTMAVEEPVGLRRPQQAILSPTGSLAR